MRGIRTLLSWVLALFLIVMFVYLADQKLFSDPSAPQPVFETLAEKSGISLFEPTGRFVTGLVELFAALLLLLPLTRRFGAFMAFCVSAMAVGLHISPWLGIEVPQIGEVGQTDGGTLFNLALALTAASGILMFVHPGKRPSRF